MRCPVCGRDGQRGEHERNVRRIFVYLLLASAVIGTAAGALIVGAVAVGEALL